MNDSTVLRLGGICALIFAGLWAVGTTLYFIAVGSPGAPESQETLIEAMRHPAYRLAFLWIWPLAWMTALPVGPVIYFHVRERAPALSLAGMVFFLANAGMQFQSGAAFRAGITLAQQETVDLAQLGYFLNLTGSIYPYLIIVGVLYKLCWGLALWKSKGLDRFAGLAFLVGFASTVVWQMAGTGSFANAMHQAAIVASFILGIGSLGISLLRSAKAPATSET